MGEFQKPKLGAVVIQEVEGDSVRWLVGEAPSNVKPLPPYHPDVCDFLSELSSSLSQNSEARRYPDVMSFGFWCRKANIRRQGEELLDRDHRLGLGLAFHITPSNVPVGFAFSFLFGLLSGNANIVRVPNRTFPQTDIICKEIGRILDSTQYADIKKMHAFVSYDRNDVLTKELCILCDVRVIWGGDDSINHLRGFPVHERCVDVLFSDRYSFSVIAVDAIDTKEDKELEDLAQKFYNDTLLMDQNACSSPSLVVWIGQNSQEAKKRFWGAVYSVAREKYSLDAGNVVDKYTKFCQDLTGGDNIGEVRRYGNMIYCLSLEELPNNLDSYRGKCGYFYEFETDDLSNITKVVTKKFQTLTYFGLEKKKLEEFVIKNRLLGIDRIVPIGQGLQMDVIWDGMDVVRNMSRIIKVL